MKLSAWSLAAALALAVGLAGNARANDDVIVTAPEYLEYLTEIREGLKEGKPKPLSKREQGIFDEVDHSIRSILTGKDMISDLSSEDAAELFASQENLKALLSGRDEERVMCARESRVGTNFRQTRCVSLETQRKEREYSQHVFRNLPADIGGDLDEVLGVGIRPTPPPIN